MSGREMTKLEQIGLVALLKATVPHLKDSRLAFGTETIARCHSCDENGWEDGHAEDCAGAKLLRDIESAVREFG